MARIAGVNIPDNKHIVISLRYVFGIGPTKAQQVCDATGIAPATKTAELSPEQLDDVRAEVAKLSTEGDLRREISMNIKRLMDLAATEVSVTAGTFLSEGSAQRQMHVLERVPVNQYASNTNFQSKYMRYSMKICGVHGN